MAYHASCAWTSLFYRLWNEVADIYESDWDNNLGSTDSHIPFTL
jgi:hypothetical protein